MDYRYDICGSPISLEIFIKEENKEIAYKGIQILKVLKELDYILISLHHQGSYYAGRDILDYEKETTAFINNSRDKR